MKAQQRTDIARKLANMIVDQTHPRHKMTDRRQIAGRVRRISTWQGKITRMLPLDNEESRIDQLEKRIERLEHNMRMHQPLGRKS